MIPFRLYHLYSLLNMMHSTPVGEANRLASYFKCHRSLGSKDRQWISSRIFAILRHQRLLETLLAHEDRKVTPESLVSKVEEGAIENLDSYQDLPWPIRYSLSDDLALQLTKDYGETKAQEIAKWFLQEAPLFIRVNTRRISVEDLQQCLGYPCESGEVLGSLCFLKRYPLQHSLAFRQGLFEIQDESSQKITLDIPMTKQDCVLDFCAGAGGKSLILAEKTQHVILHDSRKNILQEAKQRLLRAGLRNFSIKEKKSLKKQGFSLVVVDAPCSGSGVFRRHPEKKLLFSNQLLMQYSHLQRKILKEASSYVQHGGRLVYITCSLLSLENEQHIDYMSSLGWEVEHSTHIPPNQGDSFFSVHFIRK
ncbi:Ribosomal RNA small subunit methyltransferase B [Chlamydia avium]|nr:Ribosomal RNA small subunit methyltransferase B [Chlamydia avium]